MCVGRFHPIRAVRSSEYSAETVKRWLIHLDGWRTGMPTAKKRHVAAVIGVTIVSGLLVSVPASAGPEKLPAAENCGQDGGDLYFQQSGKTDREVCVGRGYSAGYFVSAQGATQVCCLP